MRRGRRKKEWFYIGAWGMLSSKKVENGLKLLFKVVSEHTGTIGRMFVYYYPTDKKVQVYVWALPLAERYRQNHL